MKPDKGYSFCVNEDWYKCDRDKTGAMGELIVYGC